MTRRLQVGSTIEIQAPFVGDDLSSTVAAVCEQLVRLTSGHNLETLTIRIRRRGCIHLAFVDGGGGGGLVIGSIVGELLNDATDVPLCGVCGTTTEGGA